ncbi:MAG: sialidase family protein [Polaromonas sp.]|nr:sialidase family protein [Polaromonas sp.]
MNALIALRRPEVKASVRIGSTVWLGAASGLYRLAPGAGPVGHDLQPAGDWAGRKIAAMAPADGGLLIAAASLKGLEIHLLDESAKIVRTLPGLPGDEAKSLLGVPAFFAGGKRGIYRLDGDQWSRVYGEGHTEVIGMEAADGQIRAFVKKQGPDALPALIVSGDGGSTWRIALETSYHDGVLAERQGLYITRWRGPWRASQPVHFEKDAANVAVFDEDRMAWIAGNKLCVRFESGARLDVKDPRFAEAEQLQLLDAHALVAGGNGAWLLDLFSGHVRDLFEGHETPADAAKIKKLWPLEDGRLLATASYGTFYSDDEGVSWTACRSDWSVLDAEGLALSPDGAWYLAAQRGLFISWDNGESWKQIKLATRPHFAELTAICFAGDRLVLGGKGGLFVSEAGFPKQLRHVQALGKATVAGLLVDGCGSVLVGTADGRLERLDPSDASLVTLAVFSGTCRPLAVRGAAIDVISAGALYRVVDGQVQVIASPATARGIDAAAQPDGSLVVWSGEGGWRLPGDAAAWAPVPNWLPHVKSVAHARRLVVTDRSHVAAVG